MPCWSIQDGRVISLCRSFFLDNLAAVVMHIRCPGPQHPLSIQLILSDAWHCDAVLTEKPSCMHFEKAYACGCNMGWVPTPYPLAFSIEKWLSIYFCTVFGRFGSVTERGPTPNAKQRADWLLSRSRSSRSTPARPFTERDGGSSGHPVCALGPLC